MGNNAKQKLPYVCVCVCDNAHVCDSDVRAREDDCLCVTASPYRMVMVRGGLPAAGEETRPVLTLRSRTRTPPVGVAGRVCVCVGVGGRVCVCAGVCAQVCARVGVGGSLTLHARCTDMRLLRTTRFAADLLFSLLFSSPNSRRA